MVHKLLKNYNTLNIEWRTKMNKLAKTIFRLLVNNTSDSAQLQAFLNSTPPTTLMAALDYRFPMEESNLDADEKEISDTHFGHAQSNNALLFALSINNAKSAEVILDKCIELYNAATTEAERTNIKSIINYVNGFGIPIVSMFATLRDVAHDDLLRILNKLILNKDKLGINFSTPVTIGGAKVLPEICCRGCIDSKGYEDVSTQLFKATIKYFENDHIDEGVLNELCILIRNKSADIINNIAKDILTKLKADNTTTLTSLNPANFRFLFINGAGQLKGDYYQNSSELELKVRSLSADFNFDKYQSLFIKTDRQALAASIETRLMHLTSDDFASIFRNVSAWGPEIVTECQSLINLWSLQQRRNQASLQLEISAQESIYNFLSGYFPRASASPDLKDIVEGFKKTLRESNITSFFNETNRNKLLSLLHTQNPEVEEELAPARKKQKPNQEQLASTLPSFSNHCNSSDDRTSSSSSSCYTSVNPIAAAAPNKEDLKAMLIAIGTNLDPDILESMDISTMEAILKVMHENPNACCRNRPIG